MAKNLLINKFNVRFNGERYSAGDVISDVPDKIANKLIKESNGTIIEIPGVNASKAATAAGLPKAPIAEEDQKDQIENQIETTQTDPQQTEMDLGEGSSEAELTLPIVDPKATVTKKQR